MPEPVQIDANTLRKLAELLDGSRGRPLRVVAKADGTLEVIEDDGGDSREPILRVLTPDVPARANAIRRIDISPPPIESQAGSIAEAFDALFWQQSAIEKFLIPYYARLLPLNEVEAIRDIFKDEKVYAVAHYPRTVTLALRPMVLHQDPDPSEGGHLRFSSIPDYLKTR